MLVSICSDFAGSFFELSAKLSFFEINVQNSKSVFELNLKYKWIKSKLIPWKK